MATQVRDRGAKALRARLTVAAKSTLGADVGVIGTGAAEGHEGSTSDLTVAQIAEIHEFGLGVPQRSWLRDTIEENLPRIEQAIAQESLNIQTGRATYEQALGRIGAFVQGLIQVRIAGGIPPGLADSTIARKGSSTPLIDTGQLRSSITYEVR